MKGLDIIFENNDFIAVDKPSGILTIPDRHDETQLSLYKILMQKYGKIFIVHRLDRDTSGLILFAKNEATHKHLSQLFEQRNIEKYYLGIVRGSMPDKSGSVNEPIAEHPSHKGQMIISKKGKPSLTDYEVLEDYGIYSLVQFNIHSGRTHQIRVHAQHLGMALIGDKRYAPAARFKHWKGLGAKRLFLHAHQLSFLSLNGDEQLINSPLPDELKAFLDTLIND